MNITLHELQDERQRLTKDFDELKKIHLKQMKKVLISVTHECNSIINLLYNQLNFSHYF